MKINLLELVDIQKEVDEVIKEKLSKPVTNEGLVLAFNVELFEYFNEIGVWKWWKHSHEIKKDRVLDELADLFAFFLSLTNSQNAMREAIGEEGFSKSIEDEVNRIYESFKENLRDLKEEFSNQELVRDIILYIGTDNETEGVFTTERFALAIFIAKLLYEDITWEELADAYREKSRINIERQKNNY